mmetsp:Transcript_11877/g.35853  ORF Transcript_11877/g.35853 Transcript_11877/m.35853 type:complete len:134 (-) Transcript_11877:18-419(-)
MCSVMVALEKGLDVPRSVMAPVDRSLRVPELVSRSRAECRVAPTLLLQLLPHLGERMADALEGLVGGADDRVGVGEDGQRVEVVEFSRVAAASRSFGMANLGTPPPQGGQSSGESWPSLTHCKFWRSLMRAMS